MARKYERTDDGIFKAVKTLVEKEGLPPSAEVLAKSLLVTPAKLRKLGNLTEILKKSGVEAVPLPRGASNFEKAVYSILLKIFPQEDIEYQKTFPACRIIKPLPFDFYIKSLNLIVEADGEQHFTHGKPEWRGVTNTDPIKNNYCKENNINLLRVRHRRFYWRQDALISVLENLRLQHQETGAVYCFNCWDGDDLLPISSQSNVKKKPRRYTKVTKYDSYVKYEIVYPDSDTTVKVLTDIDFFENVLSKCTVYDKGGKLYLSSTGKLAANTVLNVTGSGARKVVYRNGNPYDIRKENLFLSTTAGEVRGRRGPYKTSKTGRTDLTLSKAVVKGKVYHSIVAKNSAGKKKYFNLAKYATYEDAKHAAEVWLAGSEAIPKGSRDKCSETDSTLT